MVLKGDDAFFQLPGAKDFYLELEDVITLHLLGTTDTKYNAVTDLLNQDLAFETVINGQVVLTSPRCKVHMAHDENSRDQRCKQSNIFLTAQKCTGF